VSVAEPWKVVIVGGGFGGLSAAQHLNSNLVDVTVIDRRNYHLFQPLLYQVATGSLSAGEVASPLRSVLSRQKNTRVWLGSVTDLDPDSKRVLLADGAIVPYDSLIIAAGSETSYFGRNDWQEWAPGLKSIEEATTIRHEIPYAFEVAERRSVHPEEAQIILLDGAPRVLMPFPEHLAEKVCASLVRLGVQVRPSTMVKRVDKEGLTVEFDGKTDLIATTVIWAGGVKASPLGDVLASRTTAETDKGGRVKVRPSLTVPNYPDIYVVGDLASATDDKGKPLPGLAQVAMQGGRYTAKAILRKIKRQPELPPFRHFDKGSMAVIGRAAAVANVFGAEISGLLAWMLWAFIHLMYVVQFQSRLLVFIQWAIQDLTFSRGARLITGSAATDFDFNREIAQVERAPEAAAGLR